MLQLAADRQTAQQRSNVSVIPRIHALAAQLVEAIHANRMSEARKIVQQHQFPPIAWGYLASRLQQQRIPAATIELLLS